MISEREETSTAGTVRGLGEHQIQQLNSASGAQSSQSVEPHVPTAKEVSTTSAEFAIAGYELRAVGTAYEVSRWGLSRGLLDWPAVLEFGRRAGVPHG